MSTHTPLIAEAIYRHQPRWVILTLAKEDKLVLTLTEIVDKVVINPRKLTHYALDPQSPKGKHKAIVFEQLGFTKANYTELLEQLQTKSLTTEAISYGEDEYGTRYTLEIPIENQTGQTAIVITGWLVPKNTQEAHLVTLYVKKGGKR